MTQSAKILCAAIGAAAVAATSLPADAALTVREESIVPIAAFTANGNEAALKSALLWKRGSKTDSPSRKSAAFSNRCTPTRAFREALRASASS